MPPWLLLAMVLALAFALAYQLAVRRFGWRVLLYWIVILVGFLATEVAAEALNWNITRVGDLRLAPDLVASGLVVAGLWFFRL